jgi:hypothetical protein
MSKKIISGYRKKIRLLLNKIEHSSFSVAFTDPLIKGTPGKVYRKCGNPICKCAKNIEDRHGPYLVIQIRKDGKSKQIALRKNQRVIWQQAKNYQKQMDTINVFKKYCLDLEKIMREIIKQRTKKF